MAFLIALLSGFVFSLGLIASGMTNPAKIIGFLDVFGQWDPSLMLVMGGAIAVGLPAFQWFKGRGKTFLNATCILEFSNNIDKRLIIGSALFGIGWGLAGFCPGPAVVALTSGMPEVFLFVGSMLVGMLAFEFFDKLTAK